MTEENLSLLGLTNNEISVYLAIVQNEPVTHSTLATLTKIKRTTVYNVVKTLVEKSLIIEDLGGITIYVRTKPLEDWSSLVAKEEKTLERKKRAVKELLTELPQLAKSTQYSLPRIQFIDESHLEKHLYSAAPIWDASAMQHDETAWGFQDQTFVKHYEKWIDWYWEGGGHPLMQYKLFSNNSAEQVKIKKFDRRQIKFWPDTTDFTATTWILGDYVVSIITSQRPHHMVDMRDPVLAANLRAIFKKMWLS